MKHNKTQVFFSGEWQDPPIILNEDIQKIDETILKIHPTSLIRALRKEIIQDKIQSAKKPNIRSLLHVTKYPYKEQVWCATGHGPWPEYLKRFRKETHVCKCGESDVDVEHLITCDGFDPVIDLKKNWLKYNFSKIIAARGQVICKSKYCSIKSYKAIESR